MLAKRHDGMTAKYLPYAEDMRIILKVALWSEGSGPAVVGGSGVSNSDGSEESRNRVGSGEYVYVVTSSKGCTLYALRSSMFQW